MSTWTPERIAEVTRLWSEGLTTAEIGKMVGVTKNAVVGKAHRLGLPPRPVDNQVRVGTGTDSATGSAGQGFDPTARIHVRNHQQVVVNRTTARIAVQARSRTWSLRCTAAV